MRAEDDFVRSTRVFDYVLEHRAVLLRSGIADGVGHVDRRRAGRNGGFHYSQQEIQLGARGVFGRELHVVHVGLGTLNPVDRQAENLVFGFAQLEFTMNF